MRHPTHRRARLAAAGIALALAAGGCGTASADTDTTATGDVVVDQEIRALLPENVRQRGSIQLATDPSYAPMESYAADGRTIIGFDADLAAALGSVTGIRVELVAADFGSALDETVAGTYDGVLSSMTDTAEREKKADFIDYFSAGTAVVVQRGNPHGISDLKDLCGKVVAVERSTVQADLLRRSQPGCGADKMIVKTFRTNADALLQVRTGRAVAILNDFPPAAYLAADVKTRSYYQLASTVQYEPGLLGLAVAKDNTALRDALRAALDSLIRSGRYTELLQRWGVTNGALEASSVNGGS
ncbi:ABC transporter substrate-binding protein [Amorphoplanes nipponensis]|uniref:ABC transporter substrate-binding protein n=1 Tax=Actinoplanes nipponensis TaxID=135950 RepID=A0A919JH74_9ACTN|nr:ABC transporter substrate-binding protein [Actinoplanes nipponensis]GIE49002.1 ABC transporter substrate-binding protein [Actinoplanes nipponensis]